jgi:predicted DNA-binding ribbon-helix-helix protein
MWDALAEIAQQHGRSVHDVVTEISLNYDAPNLSAAVRVSHNRCCEPLRMEAKERVAAFILGLYQRLRRHGLINGLSFTLLDPPACFGQK